MTKREPESHNTEWKQSWRDEYLKWLCGYANVRGGKLFIGVNDDGFVWCGRCKTIITRTAE